MIGGLLRFFWDGGSKKQRGGAAVAGKDLRLERMRAEDDEIIAIIAAICTAHLPGLDGMIEGQPE